MGDSYMTWMRKGVSVFFEYDTPKIVHIKSKKVGVLSRFVQACILAYIIGYVIVYQKGYQKFEKVESAVTTKLKGTHVQPYNGIYL
jgi:P2X purinoceptor 4